MATLTVQDVPLTGLADVTFVAADVAGDDAATGVATALLVRNNDVAIKDVTVDTPGTVRGLGIENPLVTVPVNGLAVIPMVGSVFGSPASITYSAVDNLEVALIRLAR